MLPFVSKLIWGPSPSELDEENEKGRQEEVEETTCEEKEDWLVINFDNAEQVSGEDAASICSEMSDESWVMAPSPRFCTLTAPDSSTSSHDALENLLIEHPTMSVYVQQRPATTSDPIATNNNDNEGTNADHDNRRTRAQENANNAVKVATRHRQQLAHHLGPSQPGHKPDTPLPVVSAKMKLTRKGLRRRNQNYIPVTRGKKCYRIQQCVVKGGKRR